MLEYSLTLISIKDPLKKLFFKKISLYWTEFLKRFGTFKSALETVYGKFKILVL